MATPGHPFARHAWTNTWKFAKEQIAASAIFAGVSVFWARPWHAATRDSWWLAIVKWAVPVVGPFIVVFLLVFLWHALSAPYFILRDKILGLEQALASKPQTAVTLGGQPPAPGLDQLRLDAKELCESLQQFQAERLAGEPATPRNLQHNTPEWDAWAAQRASWHDEIERLFERDFGYRVQAMVQRMIASHCANHHDLELFKEVENETQLKDAARNFCALAENVGTGRATP
jgi:hypothetical protein